MTEPYISKNPQDLIRAQDWNQIQIQTRDEIHAHDHSGGDQGSRLDGSALAPQAILQVKAVIADRVEAKEQLIVANPIAAIPVGGVMAFPTGLPNEQLTERGWLPCDGLTPIPEDSPLREFEAFMEKHNGNTPKLGSEETIVYFIYVGLKPKK